jgi:glycosyltransferase involved in cell wall biosynthesis
MKIAVLAPSFNESSNIKKFLEEVDAGLTKTFRGHETTIFHIDNGSTDGTQNIAAETKTVNKIVFIDNSKHKFSGKGANIYVGLKLARDFDLTMMFDTDVKTFSSEWVDIFSKPIIEKSADFVVPIYTRNRYEGNTTNHFSAPLISLCFDFPFLQPIAGDFALSKKMVNTAIRSFKYESDFRYGVDTVLSWTAMGNSFKVEQIKAGKKIHNPSFGKITPMFLQVATSTFLQIHKYRKKTIKNFNKGLKILDSTVSFVSIDSNYIAKPQGTAINQLKQTAIETLNSFEYKQLINKHSIVDPDEPWPTNLASLVNNILNKEKFDYSTAEEYAKILTPLYLFRVAEYFQSIEGLGEDEINILLSNQLSLIGKLLISDHKNGY